MSTSSSAPISRKAFTPPLFGQFGKKAKDLFKKKYEFENQAKLINTTVDGIVVESTIVASNENALRGVFKSTIPVNNVGLANGVFESEIQTVSDRESKTSYKFSKLARGLSVKGSLVGVKPEVKGETPEFAEGYFQAEAEYSQEFFAGSVGVRSNIQKTLVDAVAAVGYDNLSIGAKVVVDTASKAAPTDYNYGLQYDGGDYVFTGVTEKKRSTLALSYFQQVAKGQTVGASATFGLAKPSRTLTVGTDYQVDVDTTVRAYAKIDSAKDVTVVATNVEHRLLNPNVLLGVSAEFNVTPASVAAGKLGVSLTFGDF